MQIKARCVTKRCWTGFEAATAASCKLQAASKGERSHALRGNASRDAPRPVTRSVTGCIPTQSVGTIK
ncbi:hypothetical protein E5170_15385 [Pseudomonas atacamensis]|uniref:DUF1534 domain-containing protein n=1 Tax=Pseudomonas atacamensis TaxID=2565368 RepID=A0AAQ2DAQ0_9PSED|nr:hypothetical protein E5170_15385 [Pseudomonas atacamensis]